VFDFKFGDDQIFVPLEMTLSLARRGHKEGATVRRLVVINPRGNTSPFKTVEFFIGRSGYRSKRCRLRWSK
jgi:hypothetical protein